MLAIQVDCNQSAKGREEAFDIVCNALHAGKHATLVNDDGRFLAEIIFDKGYQRYLVSQYDRWESCIDTRPFLMARQALTDVCHTYSMSIGLFVLIPNA